MLEPIYAITPLSQIRPYENNPRARDRRQIKEIMKSIKKNGMNSPIVIDENDVIINGHARYEAIRQLGWDVVPVMRVIHLSEVEKRAYRIADNRLGAMSRWDDEKLVLEFKAVLEGGLSLEETTGFSTAEIDYVLHADGADDQEVEVEEPLPENDAPCVSRLGDTWMLGAHRLMCADARDGAAIEALMAGERARMGFFDVPYNIEIDGFAVGNGQVHHPEFAMASGEMTPQQFTDFLEQTFSLAQRALMDGAIFYCCMDWRHLEEICAAAKRVGLRLMNLVVWVKTNGGMGTFYRSRHELVFAFKVGEAPHVNNFELGQHGRYRTNVWEYRGANAFGPTRDEDLASHPTVKPTDMVADAIKDVSHLGEIVIDFFAGSGTIVMAAETTARRARAMDISPAYVDHAIRRWQRATGKAAIHGATGRTFDEEAVLRLPASTEEAPS